MDSKTAEVTEKSSSDEIVFEFWVSFADIFPEPSFSIPAVRRPGSMELETSPNPTSLDPSLLARTQVTSLVISFSE